MITDTSAYLTPEGLQKLQQELLDLKNIRRMENARRISEAKELGDLKENAEYSAAKDEQTFIEGRIAELSEILRNAKIIEKTNSSFVEVGSQIKVRIGAKEMVLHIVGSSEADPAKGKISNASPLGQAFLGHLAGDDVKVTVPSGTVVYKILAVK